MPFPASPTPGTTTYRNPKGSLYKFNLKSAWELIEIGAGYIPRTNRLTILPDTFPPLYVGTAVSGLTIVASGGTGPYTYTVIGGALPTGLSLAAGGAITGTPTVAGAYSVVIRATDSTGGTALTGDKAYAGNVLTSAIDIQPTAMPALTVGKAASQTFTATGGTPGYTWAVSTGALPAGLTLNTGSGVVSGTPTATGNYSFTLRATDANSKTGFRTYGGLVAGNPLTIQPSALPQLTKNQSISVQFTALNSTPPNTWTIVGGSLPAGLALGSGTGIISGTPTTVQAYSFTIKATDSAGQTGEKLITGNVIDAIGIIWNYNENILRIPRRFRYRAADDKFVCLTGWSSSFEGTGPCWVESSSDGITWSTEQEVNFNAQFEGLLNGKQVIAGTNRILIDGVAATLPSMATVLQAAGFSTADPLYNALLTNLQNECAINIFAVAHGGGFYVAVGMVTWRETSRMFGGPPMVVPVILRAADSGNTFAAVTIPPQLVYIGAHETSAGGTPGSGSNYNAGEVVDIDYAFGKFVMMSGHGFWWSTTGATGTWQWDDAEFAFLENSDHVALGTTMDQYSHMRFVNNTLFAFGGRPKSNEWVKAIFWTNDGVLWNQMPPYSLYGATDLAWNGNMYIAVGYNFIAKSADLNTWTVSKHSTFTPDRSSLDHCLIAAKPTGGKFCIVGTAGWGVYSPQRGGVLTSYP